MLAPEHFFSRDAWENKAIAQLVHALDEAVSSGLPIAVERFSTSLTDRELVTLAVDLCKRAEANVAVLAEGSQKVLTFVPLFPSLVGGELLGLVAAGAAPEVHS